MTHPGFSEDQSEMIANLVEAYMKEQCGWQNAYEYHGHTACWKNGTLAALAVLEEWENVSTQGS